MDLAFDIVTAIVSLTALVLSIMNRRLTIKLNHQALIAELERKRQDILMLAAKINLSQIERNAELIRRTDIVKSLPSDVIRNFENWKASLVDLTVTKEYLHPIEEMQIMGLPGERVEMERVIGILTRTKEMSDRYDVLFKEEADVFDKAAQYGV